MLCGEGIYLDKSSSGKLSFPSPPPPPLVSISYWETVQCIAYIFFDEKIYLKATKFLKIELLVIFASIRTIVT